MDSKEKVKIIYEALDLKLAENIKILKIQEISVIADYMIIANATTAPHMNAVLNEIELKTEENHIEPPRIEGNKNAGWVLMDFHDVIVHIFNPEDRLFYDIERIWRDGKVCEIDAL